MIKAASIHQTDYTVLYEGPATMMGDIHKHEATIIVVEDKESSFSLRLKTPELICHQHGYITEHPQLFVILKTFSDFYFKKKSADVLDINLITCINSKFVYVERHIRTQMETLYEAVNKARCKQQAMIDNNLLSLAFINEDEFAYSYTQAPGYTALLRGEVVYLLKCVPSFVTVRHTPECFKDLPILHNNISKFMTPRNGLIVSHGHEIECTSVLSPLFKLDQHWYQVHPTIVKVPSPNVLTNEPDKQWIYETPNDLAKTGIYSQDSLDECHNKILLQAEQSSITNILSRGFDGQDVNYQGGGIMHIIDPETLTHITESIYEKTWGYFKDFGLFMSGFIGIFIVIKIFKLILDALMNGYALYKVFGFSLALGSCLWDNLAHLLISFKTKKEKKPKENDSDIEDSPKSIPLLSSNDKPEALPRTHTFIPEDKALYPTLNVMSHVM